ncbi:MAG TPA: hypothetical protein VFM37_00250 [Pseudonocardiaceae bacterium]|nr:hypothetical protein [Pseudonocardiaceae bacterium]
MEPRTRVLEAFHWGRFTTGSGSRALWLLLAPFAVLNLARYAVLFSAGRPFRDRAADAVLRLLGVALTVTLVVNVAYVAWDLLVRQCAAAGRDGLCVTQNRWLSWLAGWPFGLQLLVGALAPAATLGMLWWFGRQVFLYNPPGKPVTWREPTGSFDDQAFWYTSPKAPMLRALHLAAAFGVVGMLCVAMLWSPAQPARSQQVFDWVLLVGSGLLVAVALVLIAIGPDVADDDDGLPVDERGRDPVRVPRWASALRRLALAVAVVALGWTVWQRWSATPELGRSLGGFEVAANLTAVAVAVLLLLLALVCWRQRHGSKFLNRVNVPEAFRPFWGGFGAWMLAAVACLLGNGFAAATTFQVATLLGRPVPRGEQALGGEQDIEVAGSYWTTAVGWALLVACLLLLAAVGAVLAIRATRSHGGPELLDIVKEDYADAGTPPPRGLHRIARRWRTCRLRYRYHWALGTLAVAGGLLLGAVGVLSLLRLVLVDWRSGDPVTTLATSTLGGFGALVVTGLAGLLLLLGLRSWRSPSWRTGVGILWDLLSFWPRLAHPICPPPYGGRTVLGVADRARQLLVEQEAAAVVLSGHSQGGLVNLAAVAVLRHQSASSVPKEEVMSRADASRVLDRTCLVTYGSQLQFIYARLFPAYAGFECLQAVYRELRGHWRNVHRWTDPLGGPVLGWPANGTPRPFLSSGRLDWHQMSLPERPDGSLTNPEIRPGRDRDDAVGIRTGDEIRLRDPAAVRESGWHPQSPLRGHSGYYDDPVFDQVVADLADELTASRGPQAEPPNGRAGLAAATPDGSRK